MQDKKKLKSMYNYATIKEVKEILKNIKFISYKQAEIDNLNDDGETQFLMSMYGGKLTFGFTDYKEHRKDSFESLKKEITGRLLDHGHQRGHFYSKNGEVVKTIKIKGYYGGITGVFLYQDDINGFGR